jgi:hypothetical protein
MIITREDLKNMYIEHIEEEKRRLAKKVEEELTEIINEIINNNKLGRTSCKRKCYEYREEYITTLLTRLQNLLVDSKISTDFINEDGGNKYVLVTIDWKL